MASRKKYLVETADSAKGLASLLNKPPKGYKVDVWTDTYHGYQYGHKYTVVYKRQPLPMNYKSLVFKDKAGIR